MFDILKTEMCKAKSYNYFDSDLLGISGLELEIIQKAIGTCPDQKIGIDSIKKLCKYVFENECEKSCKAHVEVKVVYKDGKEFIGNFDTDIKDDDDYKEQAKKIVEFYFNVESIDTWNYRFCGYVFDLS